MPLYKVEISQTTVVIVVADNEDHSVEVSRRVANQAIGDESTTSVNVKGEVRVASQLTDGWAANAIPYGGDGVTMISSLLPHVVDGG